MKTRHPLTGMQLALFIVVRTVMNTSYRMVYPFLSTFQNGLSMSLGSFSLLLTLRSLTGLIGPIVAPLADRRGRKLSMLLGIGAFSASALLVTVWPNGVTFFIAVLLMTFSTLVFLPAMQAYIGDRVDYNKRGRAMGLTELSWSLAFIFGVPAIGWLLGRSGAWRSLSRCWLAWGCWPSQQLHFSCSRPGCACKPPGCTEPRRVTAGIAYSSCAGWVGHVPGVDCRQ